MPFNNSGLRSLGVNAINPPDTWFSTVDPTENDYIMHDVGKFCYVTYPTVPATWSLWYLASKANMIATWIRLYPESVSDVATFITDNAGVVVPTNGGAVNVFGSSLIFTTATPPAPFNTITIGIMPGLTGQVIGTDDVGAVRYLTFNSPGNSILFDYTTHPGLIDMVVANPGGGGGNLRSDDGAVAVPDINGIINIYGGEPYGAFPGNPLYVNIYTSEYDPADPNTLNVNLKRSINQPFTNATASEGMYALGGSDFLHAYGTENTMCGIDCGNRTLDDTLASNNVFLGNNSGHAFISGARNTMLGSNVMASATDPMGNICIGYLSGQNFAVAESSNIIIGNGLGTFGDINTIRIGTMGALEGQQNQCFIAGIWNSPAVPVANTGLVVVDQNGQLFVDDIAPDSVVMTDSGGNVVGLQGAYGTVLTGMGTAAPQFLAFKQDDPTTPSVTYAIDPATHQIIFTAHAGGTAGITNIITQTAGPVVPLAGAVSIVGNELINTDGTTANVVKVNVNRGILGSVITGNGLGNPSTYRELHSTGGTILFDYSNPAYIDMTATGGGGGGIVELTGDNVLDVPATASSVNIEGGKNIYTNTTVNSVTVNVTDDVSLLGWLHAVDEVETTSGDLIASIGSLRLRNTNIAGGGTIMFGGTTFLSNYGTANIFQGFNSGNLTLTVGSATGNTCVGNNSGSAIVTAASCVSYGANSMMHNQAGNQCTCIGTAALANADNSDNMCCLGWHAGINVVAGSNNSSCIYIEHVGVPNESNVMRLGTDGTGGHNINKTYIAGVYNRPVSGQPALPSPEMVVMGSDHRLGTLAIPTTVTSITTDSGNVTPTTTFGIKGGYNAGTRASGTDIIIDVDGSIQQNNTTAAGDGIYALGTRGANTYTANRFMHNYGTTSTYLGYLAGPITAPGGVSCVGIGANALKSIVGGAANNVAVGTNSMDAATTSTNCIAMGTNSLGSATSAYDTTAIGTSSGAALTTGGENCFYGRSSGVLATTGMYNVLLGVKAGSKYTTESRNIILGGDIGTSVDSSKVGDDRVMRLGYESTWGWVQPDPRTPPAFARIVTGTLKTYVYGIFNEVIDESATPVYVDRFGQLGTSGEVSFEYYLDHDVTGQTGDNTIWFFGTNTANGIFAKSYDSTNSVFPGNGGTLASSATRFTAPYAGKYNLTATVMYYWHYVAPPTPSPTGADSPLYILTSNNSYMFHATPYSYQLAVSDVYISEIVNCIAFLDAGDTVIWAAQQFAFATSKTITIKGTPVPVYFHGTPYSCKTTWITGHRVGVM